MEGPEEEIDDQKLRQLFKNFEHEWDFIKKKPEKTLYSSSKGSSKMIKTLGLLNNNSHRMSPPSAEVAWKVRTNDLAVEEILRERRAAIESGKLKGRRLFEEVEDVTEVGFGRNKVACSGLEIGNWVKGCECEVRSVFSYESDTYEDDNWGRKEVLSPSNPHCSYSSPSNPHWRRTEMATMAEKKLACNVGSERVRSIVLKVWLAISLVVFIVGIKLRSFGTYEDEEVILTPT